MIEPWLNIMVQKELHMRFKNMFEGDMLLPNLDYNNEFEEKQPDDLLDPVLMQLE